MSYDSDLTAWQWRRIQRFFEPPGARGRPPRHERRKMVDAILYLARTGAPWRYLPSEYPPWGAVWQQFRRWRENGAWARAMRAMRRFVRRRHWRTEDPSVLLIDAQVARGARFGPTFHEPGGRGGRINGAKRTIVVDTIGCPIAVAVGSARPHDLTPGKKLLAQQLDALPSVKTVIADRGYRGLKKMLDQRGVKLEIKAPPKGAGRFVPLKPLWRVEDAFGRLSTWRRLTRSYEGCEASARAWVEVAALGYLFSRV